MSGPSATKGTGPDARGGGAIVRGGAAGACGGVATRDDAAIGRGDIVAARDGTAAVSGETIPARDDALAACGETTPIHDDAAAARGDTAMVELREVGFRYAEGMRGVSQVTFSVSRGECVALVGASGCGKSTVTRLINGLAPAFFKGDLTGELLVGGRPPESFASWELASMVGSVFQDPKSQFFSSELAGEIAFMCENLGMRQPEIRRRVDAAIGAFRIGGLRNRPLDALSSGEAQRVAIASVYAPSPALLVMDEPTANLDEAGIGQLRELVLALRRNGLTIVIAEHRISWLLDGVADRFLLLDGGRLAAEFSPREIRSLSGEERLRHGLRSAEPIPVPSGPLRHAHVGSTPMRREDPLLLCTGLSCRRHEQIIWEDVSLALSKGDICALTGGNGTGKTTFLKIICGLARESEGSIRIGGAAASARKRRKLVWYCSNNTTTQFFTTSVEDELLLGARPDADKLDEIRGMLKRIGLHGFRHAHPATLSGGMRQRLAVALAILSDRPIVLLDEPTSGLDAKNMAIIAREIRMTASRGRAIMVATHDPEFVRACCTSVYRLAPHGPCRPSGGGHGRRHCLDCRDAVAPRKTTRDLPYE